MLLADVRDVKVC